MRIYIATALERAEEAKALSLRLKALNHVITYEWWVHGSVQDEGAERIAEVAQAEADGATSADVVIVLLPGGRGTHAELGIAIGRAAALEEAEAKGFSDDDTDIFLVGEQKDAEGRECAFYYHPAVIRVKTIDEVLLELG